MTYNIKATPQGYRLMYDHRDYLYKIILASRELSSQKVQAYKQAILELNLMVNTLNMVRFSVAWR